MSLGILSRANTISTSSTSLCAGNPPYEAFKVAIKVLRVSRTAIMVAMNQRCADATQRSGCGSSRSFGTFLLVRWAIEPECEGMRMRVLRPPPHDGHIRPARDWGLRLELGGANSDGTLMSLFSSAEKARDRGLYFDLPQEEHEHTPMPCQV